MERLSDLISECFADPDDAAAIERFDAVARPYFLTILASIYQEDPSVLDDAYQSAVIRFMKIFRRGPDPRINYEAYFVTVAKNCLIDELRRTKRFTAFDSAFGDELSELHSVESRQIEVRLVVLDAMGRLDSRCRFILERYYVAETKSRVLAGLLDMKPDSVHMAIKRCRDRLREILS